ncbi:MAG: hypothetical protein ACJAZT_000563 [Gammaproteobacteria bacterium]|jgi:hypothetical protein
MLVIVGYATFRATGLYSISFERLEIESCVFENTEWLSL